MIFRHFFDARESVLSRFYFLDIYFYSLILVHFKYF
nr:MAG TPA: hypothetical protein [Caudoviricetes sp.]